MLRYEYSMVQVSIGILAHWYKPEVSIRQFELSDAKFVSTKVSTRVLLIAKWCIKTLFSCDATRWHIYNDTLFILSANWLKELLK